MFTIVSVFIGILGAIVASFIGVIAERSGTGESWISGRSRCNSCSTPLSPADLVPIASWLSSAGRTSCCGARLPAIYAISEGVLALAFFLTAMTLGLSPLLPLFLLALSVLAFIVLYDLRHTVVPMGASVFLVALGAVYAYLSAPDMREFSLVLITGGLLSLAFFLLYALSRGRAMGLGDSPVVLGLSLLAGTAAIPGLVFSFWIGALYGVAVLVRRRKGTRMGIEVPFVPFLAAGYLLAYFTQWTPFIF